MKGSVSSLGAWLYRTSGGRRAGTIHGVPVCLVNMKMRDSERKRSARLIYTTRGEEIILIAFGYGKRKHPVWYRDIAAYPRVDIQLGRETRTYNVRQADNEEKIALWPIAAANHDDLHLYYLPKYEHVPILICTPVS